MVRRFNDVGLCNPLIHYTVDIQERLKKIKELVDAGAYFTINRARQYGKTTTLAALEKYLAEEYAVISLDFQMIGNAKFATEEAFTGAFANLMLRAVKNQVKPVGEMGISILNEIAESARKESSFALDDMFALLSDFCASSSKPVVLIIDEVDSATNNQVFLDFLAQLRAYYLERASRNTPTFQSVILAGVYDVKNIKRKLRSDEEHKMNSPWNIATDFRIDMSFSEQEIAGMLIEYEEDYHTGMDVEQLAGMIFSYTDGYPFLVSKICKLIDENIAGTTRFPNKSTAWTKGGFLEAVKILLTEKNTLFDSLMGKLVDSSELSEVVYSVLFSGDRIVYSPDEPWIDMAMMFGFAKNRDGNVVIANRIFETRLYNYFLATKESQNSELFQTASQNKSQFVKDGHLDMTMVLQKYVECFDSIYGGSAETFHEEEGRRRFLLFLRPIINGTGNYYIEAETRNDRRMDVVVDYLGEQFIIELKVWRGNAYHERGEKQIADYLDYFHLKKGYMLSYNFNQKKKIGVSEKVYGDRILVEAVV